MINQLKKRFDAICSELTSHQEQIYRKQEDARGEERKQIDFLIKHTAKMKQRLKELFAAEKHDLPSIMSHMKEFRMANNELSQMIKPWWRQQVESLGVMITVLVLLRIFIFGLYQVPTGSAEPNLLVGDAIFGNKMQYWFSDVQHGDLVIFPDPEFRYDENKFQRSWQRTIGFGILGLKNGPVSWVKRVIGKPGDVIEGRIEKGVTVVYRNGEKLNEPYVNPYPLIAMRRERGFFLPHSLLGSLLPSFLHRGYRGVKYAYDPSVSFNTQPYYDLTDGDILAHQDNPTIPLLYEPGTPCYDVEGTNVDVYGPFTVPENKYWVLGDSRKNSRDSRWWGFLDRELIDGKAAVIISSVDTEELSVFFQLLKNPYTFLTKRFRWNRLCRSVLLPTNLTDPNAPDPNWFYTIIARIIGAILLSVGLWVEFKGRHKRKYRL